MSGLCIKNFLLLCVSFQNTSVVLSHVHCHQKLVLPPLSLASNWATLTLTLHMSLFGHFSGPPVPCSHLQVAHTPPLPSLLLCLLSSYSSPRQRSTVFVKPFLTSLSSRSPVLPGRSLAIRSLSELQVHICMVDGYFAILFLFLINKLF